MRHAALAVALVLLSTALACGAPARPAPAPVGAETGREEEAGSAEPALGLDLASDAFVAGLLGSSTGDAPPAAVYIVWLDEGGRPSCRRHDIEPWARSGPPIEGALDRAAQDCPERTLAIHYAYQEGEIELSSPAVAASCFGSKALVSSSCRVRQTLLGVTRDAILWSGGAWYSSEQACGDALTRGAAAPLDLGACATPIERAERDPGPEAGGPSPDLFASVVHRRGSFFMIEEVDGSLACGRWRIVGRDEDALEMVNRRVVRDDEEGGDLVLETRFGLSYDGFGVLLLGPHRRTLRGGREEGALSYGCAEHLLVERVDAESVRVAGEPWYVTREACTLALEGAGRRGGDVATILGLGPLGC